MRTPWGELPVSDAHVHLFSRRFFEALAREKGLEVDALGQTLGWRIPPEDPAAVAATWVAEFDRYGVQTACMIASMPGDHDSVLAAARTFPNRLVPYAMVNPLQAGAIETVRDAVATGLRGICLFPAMHRYSMHADAVSALLDAVATARPVVFVHCGVLSVGVRNKLGLPSRFDMRFSNPVDLHEVALRYPGLSFVVPHFGAGYFREALMLCDLCQNVYLDTSSSNSWMRYEPSAPNLRDVFRRALDVVGARRLLFGTDSSFFPRGWNAPVFEAQATALYEVGASEGDARAVLHGNLRALLGCDGHF